MATYFPPEIMAYFAPRDPLENWKECAEEEHQKKQIARYQRSRQSYNGVHTIAQYLRTHPALKQTSTSDAYEMEDDETGAVYETPRERKERKRKYQWQVNEMKKKQLSMEWQPKLNPEATSDPYTTLFVGRLAYDTTEEDLFNAMKECGQVQQVKLVREKTTQKPKGYAFVQFETPEEFKRAYKEMDGKVIKGRKIIVDVERGRTVPEWRPRKLGGGLGSTRQSKTKGWKKEIARNYQLERLKEKRRFAAGGQRYRGRGGDHERRSGGFRQEGRYGQYQSRQDNHSRDRNYSSYHQRRGSYGNGGGSGGYYPQQYSRYS